MRYISIALLLLCIHVSGAFFNATSIFAPNMQTADNWFTKIDSNSIKDEEYIQSEAESSWISTAGDMAKGLFYFIITFAAGIVWVPFTMQSFGLTSPYIYYMSIPIYALYFLGIAQWISNRATKTMR